MPKSFIIKRELKSVLLITVLIFLAATVKLYSQNVAKTQLNISIAGIEYDDAGFTKLKESIKSNKKVQDVKESFLKTQVRSLSHMQVMLFNYGVKYPLQ